MSPFRSKYTITQLFGVNPDYYSQFGLKGHEGIDLIPTGTVWDILALEDGVVVLDDDIVGSPSADPYGKIVTIWHSKINKATMYCHLTENYVAMGQTVTKGEKIGTMGSTGNSTGAHLHLNLFETTDKGVRLNRNNGYNGGIDPLPFLEAGVEPVPPVGGCDPTIIAQSDAFIAVATKLNCAASKDVVLAELDKLVKLDDIVLAKDRQLEALQREATTLKDDIQKVKADNQKLIDDNTKAVSDAQEAGKKLQEVQDKYVELEKKAEELSTIKPVTQYSGWELIGIGLSKVFGVEKR
jgi:hypothetical protein